MLKRRSVQSIVVQTKSSVKCWSCCSHLLYTVILSIGFGQSSDTACPTLKEVHSSQKELASQLRVYTGQVQSAAVALFNLMQLMLVKQLMAEMDLSTPTGGESITSGNHSECKPKIAGSDLTGVVEAMNATINQLIFKNMENKQAI